MLENRVQNFFQLKMLLFPVATIWLGVVDHRGTLQQSAAAISKKKLCLMEHKDIGLDHYTFSP